MGDMMNEGQHLGNDIDLSEVAVDASGEHLKHGMTLNAIRGTAIDKLLKRNTKD